MAIVGSYRKGGAVDSAVEAVLAGARGRGSVTQTIYLTEQQLEFCTNCRECTQVEGEERGKCVHRDGLEEILAAVDAADGIVLASPVNFYNVTALFRRFMERLVGYAYWPWGKPAPSFRIKKLPRKAVLISTAAMPGFLIPLATGAPRALRATAKVLGARVAGALWLGMVSGEPHPHLSAKMLGRARRLGERLAKVAE